MKNVADKKRNMIRLYADYCLIFSEINMNIRNKLGSTKLREE